MRVSMVSAHSSPFGDFDGGCQDVHVSELAATLSGQGHDVTVYTRRADPDSAPETHSSGCRVVHVPVGPPRWLPQGQLAALMNEFGSALGEIWSAERPDVVHAHFWTSGLASLLAVREPDLPVVQTFYGLGAVRRRYEGTGDTSPPGRPAMERLVGRSVSRVAAGCSHEVHELTRMGVPRSRLSVVPHGVDVDRFSPDGPPAPKYLRHRLVAAGRMLARKGFDTAIGMLALLPDTELVIAGGPGEGDQAAMAEWHRLLAYAEQCGVADRLFMPGRISREEMPTLLRSADAVVCTPWYEPFGTIALEAMACGVPVVANAVGGFNDTVVDRVTGRLIPPHEPGALAAAVQDLLDDRPTRQAYGTAGRERACAKYSWKVVANEMSAVYDAVCPTAPKLNGAPKDRARQGVCSAAPRLSRTGVSPAGASAVQE